MMFSVVIDGNALGTVHDFHATVKAALEFPEYYGENPDALWDCLSDVLLSGDRVEVIWTGFNKSREKLGKDSEILCNVFNEAQKDFPDLFKFLIEN